MVKKTIGAYEVTDVLGKGGMGEVYLGRHVVLDRPVALKRLVIPSDVPDKDHPVWSERFLREGKALARLSHSSIAVVYDLFDYRRELYMAQELVDGFNVQDLMKGGAIAPDIACLIALSTAAGLEAAHRAGIIHRDVKPSNIMITKRGVVKLMDFGVAKDTEADTLTKTGAVVGTPNYLAPELLKGEKATPRSDIYAVGAMLYELLSGRRLFAHAAQDNVWGLVATGRFPRLGKVAPNLPWRLILLVERCLKNDPKRRFQSASELCRAIERFLDEHGGPVDHEARLISWLVAFGKVPEAEALTILETKDLIPLDEVTLKPRMQPWRAAALLSMLLLAASVGYIVTFTDGWRALIPASSTSTSTEPEVDAGASAATPDAGAAPAGKLYRRVEGPK